MSWSDLTKVAYIWKYYFFSLTLIYLKLKLGAVAKFHDSFLRKIDWMLYAYFSLQGQYRSTLVCPVCRKVSITFDPFMYLSLPLPSTTMRTMTLTVVSADENTPSSPCTITVPKDGKSEDLIQALSSSCYLRDDETLLVAEVYCSHCINLKVFLFFFWFSFLFFIYIYIWLQLRLVVLWIFVYKVIFEPWSCGLLSRYITTGLYVIWRIQQIHYLWLEMVID